LSGYARNLPQGTVEVVAAGPEGPLKSLLDFLNYGPTLARVDQVEVDWTDRTPLGEGFQIRLD
jgi:acylphosphatase